MVRVLGLVDYYLKQPLLPTTLASFLERVILGNNCSKFLKEKKVKLKSNVIRFKRQKKCWNFIFVLALFMSCGVIGIEVYLAINDKLKLYDLSRYLVPLCITTMILSKYEILRLNSKIDE